MPMKTSSVGKILLHVGRGVAVGGCVVVGAECLELRVDGGLRRLHVRVAGEGGAAKSAGSSASANTMRRMVSPPSSRRRHAAGSPDASENTSQIPYAGGGRTVSSRADSPRAAGFRLTETERGTAVAMAGCPPVVQCNMNSRRAVTRAIALAFPHRAVK